SKYRGLKGSSSRFIPRMAEHRSSSTRQGSAREMPSSGTQRTRLTFRPSFQTPFTAFQLPTASPVRGAPSEGETGNRKAILPTEGTVAAAAAAAAAERTGMRKAEEDTKQGGQSCSCAEANQDPGPGGNAGCCRPAYEKLYGVHWTASPRQPTLKFLQ